MSDRTTGFVVVLDHALRDDDAKATLSAIRHIRGVLAVKKIDPSIMHEEIGAERVRVEVANQLFDLGRKVARGDDR